MKTLHGCIDFVQLGERTTRVLPIVGLDVGAIGCKLLVGFSSGGTLAIWLFVFIFNKGFQLKFGCRSEVFQLPHHRQYLFVSCYKMTNFKSLTIWTIAFDFFIVIGAGHGLLCVGVFEVFAIVGLVTGHLINSEYFSLSLVASYDESLGAVGLFSLIGQTLIIVSFFIRGQKKFSIKLLGLFFLWIGFYYLTHNMLEESLSQVGFFVGLPF